MKRRHDGPCALSHAATWLLQPLLPLLICILLALTGATLAAAMRASESSLDEHGRLLNASSPRPNLPLRVRTAAAAEPECGVLTPDIAERLCADLSSGRLASLSELAAAHRLRHCQDFDFRLLLVHADTLLSAAPGQRNCSDLLLTESELGSSDRSRCAACLGKLIEDDLEVARMAQLFHDMLDRYQCYMQRDETLQPAAAAAAPLSSSFSFSSSSSSVASSSRGNYSGSLEMEELSDTRKVDEVPMSPDTFPGSSNCTTCKEAYSGWLCTKKFELYPFSTMASLERARRFLKVSPCPNWCASVETACPYFTPGDEDQNGGEPVFLCDEAHYHHSSHYSVPSDPCEQDSRRHSCCFTRQDTDCRLLNKTCPSMSAVCAALSPLALARNSSSPPPQQLQYSAHAPNGTLDSNATSAPSFAPPGPMASVPLLLTALLFCCSSELGRWELT